MSKLKKKVVKKPAPKKSVNGKQLERASLSGKAELAKHQQAILEHEKKRQKTKKEKEEKKSAKHVAESMPATAKEQAQEVKEQVALASPVPMVSDEDVKAAKEKAKAAAGAHAAEVKRLDALGLVEVEVRGTPYTLVGLKDPKELPTTEQRVEMAKRLNAVGPLLPKYIQVQHLIDPQRPHKSTQAVVAVASDLQSAKEVTAEAVKVAKRSTKGKRAGKVVTTVADGKPVKAKAAPAPRAPKAAKGKKFAPPMKVPKEGFNKGNCPATSGELIRARIVEHKLTDEQIAAEVRKLFEGRNTKESDVRWNRGQMRLAGIDAPDPVGEAPQSKGKKK